MAQLWKYLFQVKPSTEDSMTKNCIYSILYSCGYVYKETWCPLIRQQNIGKALIGDKIKKLGMADHIWEEKGKPYALMRGSIGCTPMDTLIWLSKSRMTSSNLHTAALWGYEMNDREEWRERVRNICAGSTTWWYALMG